LTAPDGTHFAAVPFQRAGLVLVAARGGPSGPGRTAAADGAIAPPFHASEVDRIGQMVSAAVAVLGDHLDGFEPAARAA
jgi:hypothetical protein